MKALASLVFGALAAASPAVAQRLGQGTEVGVSAWRVVAALAVCILLAIAAAYALRHRLRGGMPVLAPAKRRLRLVESLRLSHQIDVCLLACEDRQFLVAAGPHGAVVVAGGELPPIVSEAGG